MYDYKKVGDFIEKAEKISKEKNIEEAFDLITSDLASLDKKYLNECIGALNFIQYEKTLDWIEENREKITDISLSWGHLAAVSKFDWQRVEKWLDSKRPLSLVALDALDFCTTKGARLNQSLMMRKISPSLLNNPGEEIIAVKISQYQLIDNTPRVKKVVDKIIQSMFN